MAALCDDTCVTFGKATIPKTTGIDQEPDHKVDLNSYYNFRSHLL